MIIYLFNLNTLHTYPAPCISASGVHEKWLELIFGEIAYAPGEEQPLNVKGCAMRFKSLAKASLRCATSDLGLNPEVEWQTYPMSPKLRRSISKFLTAARKLPNPVYVVG